jgi:hypothetical protein
MPKRKKTARLTSGASLLPSEPRQLVETPDDELGKTLLTCFLVEQAAAVGIDADRITPEFAERVRRHILTLETDQPQNAALEKALHKAASGEFVLAGGMLKKILLGGAITLRFLPIGIKRSAQAAEFGRAGADSNKQWGKDNEDTVLAAAREIISGRTRPLSGRQLAALVAKKTGMPLGTVRTHVGRLRREKKLD